MISTLIFRSTVIVLCDLAAVTAGAWILWNSSATSVVSGPVEDKLLFALVVALLLSIRHTVSRSTDSLPVKTHVARVTLVIDLFLAAAGLVAWQALGIHYLGWLATFAFVFFVIGTGFQLLVDIVTSRNRLVVRDEHPSLSPKKASFATELIRLAVIVGAVIGFACMSPVHVWDIALINPLIMMISLAIGASVIPSALSHTRVFTRSSLAEDLNFAPADRDEHKVPMVALAPGTRRGGTRAPESVGAAGHRATG